MQIKQNIAVTMALALYLVPGAVSAGSQNGYRVTEPPFFPICDTTNPLAWSATNGISVAWTAGGSGVVSNGVKPGWDYPSTAAHSNDDTTALNYSLVESSIGSPVEHVKPEYYLGDLITPVSNVNWIATLARLKQTQAYSNNAVFYDAAEPRLFLSGGGLIGIDWILNDGTTNSQNYQVSGTSRDKPFRIFWTDEPFNSPPVDLSGKFVKFYGDADVIDPRYGSVTNMAGGVSTIFTNAVIKGLFLDPSTHWLQAKGDIQGRVVMAYYSSGNFDKLLTTIVVEVGRPDKKNIAGFIGQALNPTGDGYNGSGLSALATVGLANTDGRGPYLYQYSGAHSYSPNNGKIYAIRKTVGEAWNIEVVWRQTDPLSTSWPFEVLNYECDWPTDAQQFVRGNLPGTNGAVDAGVTIPIPTAYTPTLMDFQEPDGHAVLNNGNFSTKTNGYSLLKLTGTDANDEDNIWFIPIHSIMRDESKFDLTPGDWPVGTEVVPLPTSVALQFDGTPGWLDTHITNGLNDSFTIEGYFNFTNTPATNQILFSKGLDFRVEVTTDGHIQAVLNTNAISLVASNVNVFQDGSWRHIALVYDQNSTNYILYVKSQLKDEPTSATATCTRPAGTNVSLYFGKSTFAGNSCFAGKMDDLRVWSRALTASEIAASRIGFLHTAASNTPLLVAYYPVENGIGRVAEDRSGNGHHADMVNCIRVAGGAIGLSEMEGYDAYHGYIYEAASGNNYNPKLYSRPDAVSTNSDDSTQESYIFAVNKTATNDRPLEIWWSRQVPQAAMPAPIYFPSWVQTYQFHWPLENYSVPEIVLASQKGSANLTLSKHGAAVDFSRSPNSRMRIEKGDWFARTDYTVECWVKPHNLEGGANGLVFDFNNGNSGNRVALQINTNGAIQYFVSVADGLSERDIMADVSHPVEQGKWAHLALVVSNGAATVYLNGKAICQTNGVPAWSAGVQTTNNFLACGVYGGETRSFDGAIDDFRIWEVARSSNDVYNSFLVPVTGKEPGLRLYYSFDDDLGNRGNIGNTTQGKYAFDKVDQSQAYIFDADFTLPGAPQLDRGVIIANEAPFVYYQNDSALPGFNPNEEHAWVTASDDGYVTYALRCDLNETTSSDPYVLVQYQDPDNAGRPRMQLYQVVTTNQVYTHFSDTMTAGTGVPGPHPLDFLPDPWTTNTYWQDENGKNSESAPGYRDRKKQVWAKRAGPNGTTAELEMHNYYPMQDGFYFPRRGTTNQPPLTQPISWLCRLTDQNSDGIDGTPTKWTWTINWPSNSPSLDIGQTLTLAKDGLPEVWAAKSMNIIYEPTNTSVALYDPIVIQSASVTFTGDYQKYFGFETGPKGNIQLKNGKTFFKGVPPNVSDRFYFDPTAAETSRLKLAGNLDTPTGGQSYLQLNVLSAEERVALQGLALNNTNVWIAAIKTLATERMDASDSHAVVNYALTHMGPGAGGYVTLIENNATNKTLGVNEGDPVNMHIIHLTTNLYAGAVIPKEDPENLLSEQLDILYTESFAGNGSNFVFEWKRAEPNADGTTPSDYTNQFSTYRSEPGLTRFTIGKQGDTLPDMVNNFYVMRYRALSNSPVYAITGDTWSPWTVPPTLAEGWVQRVLNNITPFTQRMQDLYDNPAETTVSMIQQAGAPYEGDVALNQANMTSVGLIQLYQTVLNKAESMSLTLKINNTAANQQLMLAATRLNDLYMLLGNEAYADAMDPTIGFGSDFFNSGSLPMGGVDYGSLSSSLFCFDNLVPTLRDEELALLRGRSDALAPALTLSPTYNRLYWNFTKGITAGEVAYAMNYQIQGSAATIGRDQAAALYPQGHGDAWGHYLSAIYGYYRLMRNPCFSWGTPSISPMLVGKDAVVDADYYDEEKFGESAAALARTGADVVKRTCEKAYLENDGTASAGYTDTDSRRAFGYGEWGARAGLSAIYNWAAANSLLPAAVDPVSYDFMSFTTNTQLKCLSPSTKLDFSANFTIEFKIKPDRTLQIATGRCNLFDWYSNTFDRTVSGSINISLDPQTSNLFLHVQDAPGLETDPHMTLPTLSDWSHVAITYAAAPAYQMTLFLNGVPQGTYSNVEMSVTTNLTNAVICLGDTNAPAPFTGALSEFRIWNGVRATNDLVAARDGVSASASGLVMYQRFIADAAQGAFLPDEAAGSHWEAEHPLWQKLTAAGVTVAFVDKSILRINRDSVGSLSEICAAMKEVQRSLDMADAGLTPIGLSGNAIPFDIDPAELAAGKSHFEQITERAEQALANAATLLDRAQAVSKLQRQQTQSAINMQQDLANEEAALNTQLIGIFGYPYSSDIGAGATYPQGYDGPDLYHYMWMDLAKYGVTEVESTAKKSIVFKAKGLLMGEEHDVELTFNLAANGMIIKPDDITGTRRAEGRLQAAYGAFIQADLEFQKALLTYDETVEFCEGEAGWAIAEIAANSVSTLASEALIIKEWLHQRKLKSIMELQTANELKSKTFSLMSSAEKESLLAGGDPVVGLANTVPVKMVLFGVQSAIVTPISIGNEAMTSLYKYEYALAQAEVDWQRHLYEIVKEIKELVMESHKITAEIEKLIQEVNEASKALDVANAALINAQESYLTVLAEGEQVLSKREALRKQAVNRIAASRYQDMAFRTFRNDALAKYGNAFDFAKKYTYLATKAYDYETALGLGVAYSSDPIFREIIGARNLGFVKEGQAQLGGLHGDGGLADVLARLKANWLVLKGRLGINNAEHEQNWLSLRSECFRIRPEGTEAQTAWQNKLSSFQVDNLLDYPEFRRYCLPFESTAGLRPEEPGLVIPFSTTIDFARNVFGWPLAGNDHAFDSSHYATKISKLGIKFIGYNNTTNTAVALANEPRVYLIPVGNDVMRSPGSDGGDVLAYNVVDQVVPVPFPLGTSSLDEPDWTSIYDAYTGNGDPLATIRRYPSLRAYHDHGTFTGEAMLSNTRLVGRSVWNTRWLLIIPAGTLAANREFALKTLIQGADLNGDGKIDQPGILDIQIGFDTYSNAGN